MKKPDGLCLKMKTGEITRIGIPSCWFKAHTSRISIVTRNKLRFLAQYVSISSRLMIRQNSIASVRKVGYKYN